MVCVSGRVRETLIVAAVDVRKVSKLSNLSKLMAQESLRHFSLPLPLPRAHGQTTTLLQSVLADKCPQQI